MIDFSDQPFVVTLEDATAGDDGQILLFGVSGPDDPQGLVLAARVFEWYPLDKIRVETLIGPAEPVEDEPEP